MKDNLSIVITMLVFVILIVIFPLYNYFERQDDMSYNIVLKATTNFVDQVLECGYIDQEMYDAYANEVSRTGNVYNIEMEAHTKVRIGSDASGYNEEYYIRYNDDIFESSNGDETNLNKKVLKGDSFYLEEGDKFFVRIKNSNTTMAGAIFNTIVPTSTKDRIVVDYGGVVKNTAWKVVDSEYSALKKFYSLKFSGQHCKIKATYSNGSEYKSGEEVVSGTEIKLEIESVDADYVFKKWINGDTNQSITVTVNQNLNYEAIVSLDTYAVEYEISDDDLGTIEIISITDKSSNNYKDDCIISYEKNKVKIEIPKRVNKNTLIIKAKATPKDKYCEFVKWTQISQWGKEEDLKKNKTKLENDFKNLNAYKYKAYFQTKKLNADSIIGLKLRIFSVEGLKKSNTIIPNKANGTFEVNTNKTGDDYKSVIYGDISINYKDLDGNEQWIDTLDPEIFVASTKITFNYEYADKCEGTNTKGRFRNWILTTTDENDSSKCNKETKGSFKSKEYIVKPSYDAIYFDLSIKRTGGSYKCWAKIRNLTAKVGTRKINIELVEDY